MSNRKVNKNAETRKRKSFTILEKCDILNELEKSSVREICEKHSVPRRTLRTWVAGKEKLEEQRCSYKLTSNNKRIKVSGLEDLGEALYVWFSRSINAGAALTGPLIAAKAKELHAEFGIEKEFYASDGWLSNWKKKYDIRQHTRCGEKMSADAPAAQDFKIGFQKFMDEENLLPCQVFTAAETGLNYKQMPKKTLAEKSSGAPSRSEVDKERVTIMLCSNADGSLKIPLTIIGKSAKPRAIKKQIESKTLPVYYASQKRAWMNTEIFKKWYEDEFVKRVKQFLIEKELPLKAKLLLGNAPCHPPANELVDGDITAMYFPANTTSILQPMDQGIIETFKKHYRLIFLFAILHAQKNGIDIVSFLKSVDIKKVIDWVTHAWNILKVDTIYNCWKKVLLDRFYAVYIEPPFTSHAESTDQQIIRNIRRINGYENVDDQTIQNWITHDSDDVSIPTNAELVNMMSVNNDAEESNDALESNENIHPNVAVAAANTLLSFFESNPVVPESVIVNIKEARLAAMKINISQ